MTSQAAPWPLTQAAPWPGWLDDLVRRLTYRPGWTFALAHIDRLQRGEGLTLDIVTNGFNSYHPDRGESYQVHHYMPVPPAAYDRRSWQRWLLEQLLLVESHEACEFFTVDGVRPYAPNHGPGRNPYTIVEVGTAEAAATSVRGEVNR